MERLPRLTAPQVIRALRRDGWYEDEKEGGHRHLRHPTKHGKVTVPAHSGDTFGPWLLHRILDQAGLTADEFRRLLR